MLRSVTVPSLLFLISACVTYQPAFDNDNDKQTTYNPSCIAFDIPSITITPASTAMERQLVGEAIELEAKGWMITSTQSTVPYSRKQVEPYESTGDISELRRYYIELGVLHYYEKKVNHYFGLQILGEGFDGKLRVVPLAVSNKGNREQRSIAKKITLEVNRAREWIYRYQLAQAIKAKERKVKVEEIKERVRKKYLYSYFVQASKDLNQWIYQADKKWSLTTIIR